MLAAVQFLTRVPVPTYAVDADTARIALRRGIVYFPLVGLLIGGFTGGILLTAEQLWPPFIAVLLALAIEAMVTGAFHEDAVADFCDAFGGGWTRESILLILRDSRIGSFGTVGLGLALALRVTLLASLDDPKMILAASIGSSAWGRGVILLIMRSLAPVTDRDSLTKDVAQQITTREVIIGWSFVGVGMAPLMILAPGSVIGAMIATGIFVIGFVRYLDRKIGGVTGDCLGTACYTGQLIVLFAVTATLGSPA